MSQKTAVLHPALGLLFAAEPAKPAFNYAEALQKAISTAAGCSRPRAEKGLSVGGQKQSEPEA